jgi:phage head maturation protease
MTQTGPRGWHPSKIEHRLSNSAPLSYDAASHSVECVISAGAAVTRFYGREVLEISRSAIDLSRIPVPLLDSHSQGSISAVLGRIDSAWINGGQLHGRIIFAQTQQGREAEAMIRRNELSAVSAGYRVEEWEIADADGDIIDADDISWNDDLTFTATRWALVEASLVAVPADGAATIRSLGGGDFISDIRARMYARQEVADIRARMMAGQRMSIMMHEQLETFGDSDD